MERNKVTLLQAKELLQNGDILLFRGSGWYSRWLTWAGRGDYTHSGICARFNGHINCLEFREFKGSRSVALEGQVELMPGEIDVFRLNQYVNVPVYNKDRNIVEYEHKEYGVLTRRAIADTMWSLTGKDYSWTRIWRLSKYHIPILRFFQRTSTNDIAESPEEASMVCSTAVAYCFRKNGVDLVPNLSDFEVDPSTLSRSPLINYLFTLVP